VPRQELVVWNTVLVAPPGAGNTRKHQITLTLPKNFSFVLVELQVVADVQIETVVNNWAAQAEGAWKNGGSALTIASYLDLRSGTIAVPNTVRPYSIVGKTPSVVMIPQGGQECQAVLRLTDPTDNGPLTSVGIYARFLMYDIAQAHHWEVNTPTLTR